MSALPLNSPRLPHLNGLRAVAILGVLFYHLRVEYCPAGYFGVDVFLVLSGFLLFRSLFRTGAESDFRFGAYGQKKAWRILPSWFVLTLVAGGLAALLLYPTQLGETMETAAASALFAADYTIDHSGDYFNPLSQQNPLLHFWYLSITCQLYLISPLLVIPVARYASRRAAMVLLAALALLSFAFYLLTSTLGSLGESLLHAIGAKTAYYHLIPRFWEVAAGYAVFLMPGLEAHPRWRAFLGSLGLMGLVGSFYLYSTGSPAVFLTVFCTLLCIRYAGSGAAARLLNSRPVQALGTISFSLYLWHWPLMVFWKYCRFDHPTLWDDAGMLAISLLLGALAWRMIESRKAPAGPGRASACLRFLPLLCLPLVLGSALLVQQRAQQFRDKGFPTAYAKLIQRPVVEQDAAVLQGFETLPTLGLKGKPLRLGSAEGEPRFMLIGDSHAQHLYDALHEACLAVGIRGIYLNNTISPYWNLIQPQVGADTCRWNPDIAHLLLGYLDAHPSISHVLVGQCWQMRMSEGYAQDGRTGQPLRNKKERQAVTGPGLGLFCDHIRRCRREVVLLGETPRFSRPYPMEEWHRRNFLGVPQRLRHMSCREFEERHAFPLATLRSLAAEGRARLIELTPALQVGDAYPAQVEGEFWYYDANHLTPAAARRVAKRILQQLPELMPASATN